jgi:phosphoglucomutase
MNEYLSRFEAWRESDKTDAETKAELNSIKDDEDEIKLRFSSYLEFGTAGLRGRMAAGTNAMNIYTVMHTTQGFADYINSVNEGKNSVVIAYDSRRNSKLFAQKAASVLAANGIDVYIFDELRPTPELSFAVRKLGCTAGINITASHNPKTDNGYKAYWSDGAQISVEQAKAVSDRIKSCDIFADIKYRDFDEAKNSGIIKIAGAELDEAFMDAVTAQQVNPDAIRTSDENFKIVYTPLHGAGRRLVPEVLRRCGLRRLYTVAEQMIPDGSFPRLEKPNPEYPEVFREGIKLADEIKSDLIIANDPDCDRTGAMARGRDGSFVTITGNQMGALLLDYIITAHRDRGSLPRDAYAIKTIVSTELVTKICAENKIKLYNVLTGFKYIGEIITGCENAGRGTFLFGFEESYGYMKGTYARDKDGVVTAMLICEAAAYYRKKGMTLTDALEQLYHRYGYYSELTAESYFYGLDGKDRMTSLMNSLRNRAPDNIGGMQVVKIRDYLAEKVTVTGTGETYPTGLPKSNVLYFELSGGCAVVIRPSGTEPKIKLYYLMNGRDRSEAESRIEAAKQTIEKLTKT